MSGPTLVYALCFLTCAACAGLLLRAWLRTKMRLLMWAAWSFVFLAINNFLVLADLSIFPEINLAPYRLAAVLAAVTTLIVGFIWETQ